MRLSHYLQTRSWGETQESIFQVRYWINDSRGTRQSFWHTPSNTSTPAAIGSTRWYIWCSVSNIAARSSILILQHNQVYPKLSNKQIPAETSETSTEMRTQSHWNFTIHSPFQRIVFQVKNFHSLERSPPRPCLWQIHLKDNKALNWENCHIQPLLHNQSLLGYCLKAYLYTLVQKHHIQTLVLVVEANPEKNIQSKEWKQNKWFTPITDKRTTEAL
jgi:hypothetical protein